LFALRLVIVNASIHHEVAVVIDVVCGPWGRARQAWARLCDIVWQPGICSPHTPRLPSSVLVH
jgi:hypothetical protein